MAASTTVGLEQKIRAVATEVLKQAGHGENVIVQKRKERSRSGDYFIIILNCRNSQTVGTVIPVLQERLQSEGVPVDRVIADNPGGGLSLHLNRTACYQSVILATLDQGSRYGLCVQQTSTVAKQSRVLVNNSILQLAEEGTRDTEGHRNLGLETLRALVLHEHLSNLLLAHGYAVTNCASTSMLTTLIELLSRISCLNTDWFTEICLTEADSELNTQHLRKHPCVLKTQSTEDAEKREAGSHTVEEGSCSRIPKIQSDTLEFNLRQSIDDRCLKVGGKHFDKHLNICCVVQAGEPCMVLQQAIVLNKAIQISEADVCIHLVNQSESFKQQRVHLVSQALHDHQAETSQSHFVYGPVVPKPAAGDGEEVTADRYLSLRYKQMKQAALMKYGDSVNGDGWESTLTSLTAACVKFELLSCVARNSMKVTVTEEDDSTLIGSFVMYNCARLSTLFSHFEEAVNNGTYPSLPPVGDIDFSTLREEAEWALLFKYVYQYPEVVRQTVDDVRPEDGIYTKLHTHQVCQMLHSLSRQVSSYYSRYHVLVEARPHLLPTMYARIYLLKAVYQVFINGLALLGIQPMSQL